MVDSEFTRSDLEITFLELCLDRRIPRPVTAAIVCGYEVDFFWPNHRLVVETDGREDHGTHAAFEEDRIRDAKLTAAGYRVVRFTYRQVARSSSYVADVVRALLAQTPTAGRVPADLKQ